MGSWGEWGEKGIGGEARARERETVRVRKNERPLSELLPHLDFLELFCRLLGVVKIFIRVPLEGSLPVGLLDLIAGGGATTAEQLVVTRPHTQPEDLRFVRPAHPPPAEESASIAFDAAASLAALSVSAVAPCVCSAPSKTMATEQLNTIPCSSSRCSSSSSSSLTARADGGRSGRLTHRRRAAQYDIRGSRD